MKKTSALLHIVWSVVFRRNRNVLWNDVFVIAQKNVMLALHFPIKFALAMIQQVIAPARVQ